MLSPIHNSGGDGSAYPAATQALSHSQSTSQLSAQTGSELTLLTQEGDRVTISAQAQMAYRYSDFNLTQLSRDGAVTLAGSSEGYMRSSSFQIEVVGELNEQELADIQELVGLFKQTITQFFEGDLQAIVQEARNTPETIGALDTIAAFDYEFSLDAQMQATQSQTVSVLVPESAAMADNQQSTGNLRNPAELIDRAALNNRPNRETDQTPSAPENYRIERNPIDELAARLVENVRELRLDSQRFEPIIPNLVERAVTELQSEDRTSGMRDALDSIKQDLTDRFDGQNTDRNYRAAPASAPNGNRYISARA